MHIHDCALVLQVGLSIKAHRLDVGYARGVGTLEQDEIRGEPLVLVHLDHLAHLNIFPRVVLESMRLLVDSLDGLVVFNVVLRSSL